MPQTPLDEAAQSAVESLQLAIAMHDEFAAARTAYAEQVGAALKELRVALGWGLPTAARRIGNKSHARLRAVEAGQWYPHLMTRMLVTYCAAVEQLAKAGTGAVPLQRARAAVTLARDLAARVPKRSVIVA